MAFELVPPPNFNVAVPDLTQKAVQGAQLRAMLSEQALRQQLAPSQIQSAQAQAQQASTQATLGQMQLESNKKLMDLVAGGLLDKFTGKNSNAPEGSAFDATGATAELARNGIMLEVAQPLIQHFQNIDKTTSEIAKNYGAAASDFLNNRAKAHSQLAGSLDDALRSENPGGVIPSIVARYLRDPQGLSPDEINGLKSLQGLSGDALTKTAALMSSALNLGAEMDRHHAETAKAAADAAKAQQGVIDTSGTSPEQRAEARKQIMVETSPQVEAMKVRLASATEKARVEAEAGDPSQMGVMMATGMVAPSEIISKFKPELTQKMLAAAEAASQRLYGQPFNAARAEAQYNYAKNPATQNTLNMITAMTDKGGSIEIAKKAAEKLPKFDEDTVNKVFNAVGREFGSSAATNFHTAMMGVADEYSKVMGGGVSSDTGRQQALDILKANYSAGQLSGAIDTMEQDLAARKRALVRDNPTLNALYPPQQGGTGGQLPKSLTAAQITAYAQSHGVSEVEVRRQAKAQGISVP